MILFPSLKFKGGLSPSPRFLHLYLTHIFKPKLPTAEGKFEKSYVKLRLILVKFRPWPGAWILAGAGDPVDYCS